MPTVSVFPPAANIVWSDSRGAYGIADAGTHDEQHAIRMCTSCPVRALCLAYALHLEQGAATTGRRGIWAGTSPRERRALHEHAMAIRSREARREAEV